MNKQTDINFILHEVVTDYDAHISRAIFSLPNYIDLQAIITWYGDGRFPTLFMNRRNNARLLALSAIGVPISDSIERGKLADVAKGLLYAKLSRFKRAI